MPRLEKRETELARLYEAVVCGRLAIEAARGELIEALGDWMCGGDVAPPGQKEMEALARLTRMQECIEAEYACGLAALSEAVLGRLRRNA